MTEARHNSSNAASKKTRSAIGWRILALIIAVGLTLAIYLYRDRVVQYASYGYLGLFVVSVVGNATILLPMPSLAATFVAGGILNPWLVALVSAAGMSIGELSGYLAGIGGTAIVEPRNRERYQRLEDWMRRHGFLTIFVLGTIPNPFFDLAGVAAGILHFPLWYFLLACFLGKLVKAVLFALAGTQSLTWVERF